MIYLDNAATSRFKPRKVSDAVLFEIKNASNSGRGGHRDALNASLRLYTARKSLLDFVGADDSYEAVFCYNCTEAANLALFGSIINNQKSHIITTLNEHNAVLRPLFQLSQMGLCELSYAIPNSDGKITADAIAQLLTEDTKLIAVNHISNVTGAESDIEAIGKLANQRGIMFFVDGAQSLGHARVDVKAMNITFLAGAAHKGLHGIQGAGFLVFKKENAPKPIRFGGTGTDSDSILQPATPPEAFESGTLAMPAISALFEGIKWTKENFVAINRKLDYLSQETFYGLKSIGMELYTKTPSPVISFNLPNLSSQETADFLDSFNIAVRGGLHCAPLIHKHLGTLERGAVRVSLGVCNCIKDVNALLFAVEKLKIQQK